MKENVTTTYPTTTYEPAPRPMRDRFRFVITDAAEAVIVHEALMSYRNRDVMVTLTDHLRREAADRILAALDRAIQDLVEIQRADANVAPDFRP